LQEEIQKEVDRIVTLSFRDNELLTVLGPVEVKRAYYYDQECGKGCCPKDTALDIVGTSFSPGIKRIMGRVGAYRPFGPGHEDIKEMAGICVDTKGIERACHQLGRDVEVFPELNIVQRNYTCCSSVLV